MNQLRETLEARANVLFADSPGWVYAVSNQSMPGIIKIGMTRKSLDHRVKQLGIVHPFDFEIVASARVRHARVTESILHEHFADRRVRAEFFAISEAEAKEAISLCEEIMSGSASERFVKYATSILHGNRL